MIKKIMFVDDDYSTNLYHEILLEESEVEADLVFCEEVDQALENLKSCSIPPDIIFLDINMPIKTGWDFLEEYKVLDNSKKARNLIVLSTTKVPSEIEMADQHYHVDHFDTKPLDIDTVRKIIKELS